MSFDVKNKSCPKYFRLRIMSNNYGTMFEKYKPKNSFFDSAFIETEIIDFRINEKRNQDSGLMETIDENNELYLKKLIFLSHHQFRMRLCQMGQIWYIRDN